MLNEGRVEYWHEWSEKGKAKLRHDLEILEKKLNEDQLKEAKSQIQLCLANFDSIYEVVHILASDLDKDHDVYAYVDRSVDYIKYMSQDANYYEGLLCGIHNKA